MTCFQIYLVVTLASLLFALWVSLCHNVHMFQQNSYRPERYFRWRRGALRSTSNFLDVLVVLYVIYVIIVGVADVDISAVMGFITASCVFNSVKVLRQRSKIKLAYTSRVKRLLATSMVLAMLIAVVFLVTLPLVCSLGYILLIVCTSELFMLLAYLVNSPMERMITNWYIRDARRIIASHPRLVVIGITGSYGKTSTKNYLYRILSEKYNVLVTPGNFNTLLGVVRTIREQLRPQHEVFIVEMGAKQRGDIAEICDLVHPSIGIISSVGEAHLETFGSVENIQRTKFELIDSLPASGLAVLNWDSESVREHQFTAACPVVRYGVKSAQADVVAHDVSYNTSGLSFSLEIGERAEFTAHLLGEGNILNLLAGIAVARQMEVPVGLMQRAIKQLQPVEHRLSMRKGGVIILDDAYNSNPAGARMALDVLRNFERKDGAKRIVITPGFVEMGANQYKANCVLGGDIAASVDYAIVVNRLNREAITKGLSDAGFPSDKLFVADSLAHAREHLATVISSGDVVLYENDLPDTFE